MRFFAHDGQSTHGPAGIEELLKLPGFDGDTLVCPVGSNDTADWKPALAYPLFKRALLEAAAAPTPTFMPMSRQPISAIVPMAAPMPVPAALPPLSPKAKQPCPRCAHANLEEARFCNSCGTRMDGRDSSPPALAPAAAKEPPSNPFAHLDPMLSYPAQPAPATPASLPESAHRPLQPGKMGRLGGLEESEPAAPTPVSASDSSAETGRVPEPAPAAEAVPIWKRPAALAAFAGAALVAAGLAYVMFNKSSPRETVAELTPAAPASMPEAAPAPLAPPLYTTPPAPSSLPPPVGTPKPARKPRAKPAPAPDSNSGGDTLIESRVAKPQPKPKGKRAAKANSAQANPAEKDPLLEALLTDSQSSADTAAEAVEPSPPMIGQRPAGKPSPFSLPGLQRPVSASDRAQVLQARTPRPASGEVPPTRIEGLDAPPLAEPGKSSPTPGIEDEPVKSVEGDQLALVQVHEQFDFCAQLLAQGAYDDHYDTCLCKDAREATPHRGRRGFYATAKKKEASAGRLETTAKILASKIENGVAKVTARWKSGSADKGRDASQTWKLEDGLWCQAP